MTVTNSSFPSAASTDSTPTPQSPANVLTEEAWALQNKLNPFPVAGTLAWDGTTLRFTLATLAGEAFVGWVEERSNLQNLKTRLQSGERVDLFAWTRPDFTVSWPAMYAGSALEVQGPGGEKWLIALDYPSGGSISQTISLFTGRKKGKSWKKALGS